MPEVDAIVSPQDAVVIDWRIAARELLDRNVDVALARIGTQAAAADQIRAAARPNPLLTLSDTGWRGTGPARGGPSGTQADFVARLDTLFERGNKRALRMAAAESAALAAGLDFEDARRQALAALGGAFADLAAAQRRVLLAREIADSFGRASELARRRVRAGDLAPADAVRAEADASRARNDVTAALADLQAARTTLAQLLGRITDAPRLVVDADALPEPAPADDVVLLERRADVRAAAARVDVAQRNAQLAQALRTRDVSIGTQIERLPGGGSPAFGFSVSVPLFVNYGFEGEIRRAQADLDGARIALERQRLAAAAEIRQLRTLLAAAQERERRFTGEIVPLARRAAEAAQFAFARGAATILEVLDAQRQLRAAELDSIAASTDRVRAQVALAVVLPPGDGFGALPPGVATPPGGSLEGAR